MSSRPTREGSPEDECRWCGTTGGRNRKIFWTAVLIITLVVVFLYLLARL